MRVLALCHRFGAHRGGGGAEAFAAALSIELVRQGHAVTVIAGSDTDEEPRDEEGVSVHRVAAVGGRMKGPRLIATIVREARALPRHDVVHAHSASTPAVNGVFVSALWRAPLVVTPSTGIGRNLAELLDRRLGRARVAFVRRRTDAFAVISDDIRDDLVRSWRVPDAKLVDMPYGVDLDRFAPRPGRATTGQRTFVFAGRLLYRKGVGDLIEAWKKASEPGTLMLVGDGADRAAFEAAAPASVRFVGGVEDPAPLYREADVFVLPSYREGRSIALLEAIASGLPVIATPVGATPDVLGDRGRLVPVGDVDALAAALAQPSPALVDRESFATIHGLTATAKRHVELYERLIAARS